MGGTYASSWTQVQHKDVTTHNPKNLVGTSRDIEILSAQIQWRGVQVLEQTTITDGPYTLHINENYVDADMGANPNIPSIDGNLDNYEWIFEMYDATGNEDWYPETYEFLDANLNTIASGYIEWGQTKTQTTSTRRDGDEWDAEVYNDDDVEAIDSYDVGEATLEVHYDKDLETRDPQVTRDVSADGTGEVLEEGVKSAWYTLSGLAGNKTNEFYHNISGSQIADFQFEFDWEYKYPQVVYEYRIYDESQNAIHKVALADPADAQLKYNHHRFSINGNVYALDVVDPSDEDAISWRRWYHPTHGIYCPRAYETIQL